jgi:DNA-binding winged helix-turn-helix (wHTH) protein
MTYLFEGFSVHDSRYELCRDGVPLHLEPKVFDVLIYLLMHRERVVTKDELIDSVWDGVVVTDSALSKCVANLRKTLGVTGRSGQIIKTVHGRGYRFVAQVTETAASGLRSPRDQDGGSQGPYSGYPRLVGSVDGPHDAATGWVSVRLPVQYLAMLRAALAAYDAADEFVEVPAESA